MNTELANNPFAERALHYAGRAAESSNISVAEKAQARAAVAQAYATLANAYETRTATLASLHISNNSAAREAYGAALESAPPEVLEFFNEKAEELAERLGVNS